MKPEPQSLSTLCWFSCYVMMFRWNRHEEKKIKDDIKRMLRDAGIDLVAAGKKGLKLRDNKKAAQALGLRPQGYGQPVTLRNLQTLLRHSPVWATGQWMPNNNHVLVITGASKDWVEYYDPWWVGSREDALTLKKRPTKWILHGDGKKQKGLAHTHRWFPLSCWKT